MREPTTKDIEAALDAFRGTWDWDKCPVLRVPLNFGMMFEEIAHIYDPPRPFPVRYAEIRLERGSLDGRPAKRLVGTIPGTDLFIVLETIVKN